MGEITFVKNEYGQIVKVLQGDNIAEIKWIGEWLDINYCNYVIQIAFGGRGVG